MSLENCPCGSKLSYSQCCEPIISQKQLASSPEVLMRSRYTSYVKQEIEWLKLSLEPSQRSDFDEKSVLDWAKNSQWQGLKIIRTEKGGEDDNVGFVEFTATFKQDNISRTHHELGEFRKVNNQWFFYDGNAVKPAPFKHEKTPVKRNDPCTCGSGKKHKKCCGA
ncbi:MAG: YchJ family protein [Fibrobacter sp.]|nr:YchJ family protein [Fibrobacter sp.]